MKIETQEIDMPLKAKRNALGNSKVVINTIVPKFEYKNSSGKKTIAKAVLF